MSLYRSDGMDSFAYHSSDTLEIDRDFPGRRSTHAGSSFDQNSYDYYEENNGREHRNYSHPEVVPMTSFKPEPAQNVTSYSKPSGGNGNGVSNPAFEGDAHSAYTSVAIRNNNKNVGVTFSPLSSKQSEGNNTTRRRFHPKSSIAMGTLSRTSLARIGLSNEELEEEEEQEKLQLVQTIAEMSTTEATKAIRQLPLSMKEKQDIRNRVKQEKSYAAKKKQSQVCTDCCHRTSVSFRRFKETMSGFFQSMQLWQKTLKVIGGKFGTSVLSYFTFLKWLLMFNIFSFLVNFSFITIPQLFDLPQNNMSFSGLELLTGAGYFEETVLYYGFYKNTMIKTTTTIPYNMQLAYIFTIGVYLIICFLSLVYSMSKSFRENFIIASAYSGNAAKLLYSWDFNITNAKAVKLKHKNMSTQLKETLSDKTQQKVERTCCQKIAAFAIHLVVWIACIAIAGGCCGGVYFLSEWNANMFLNASSTVSDIERQGRTLLMPIIVAIINLIIPLLYSFFGRIENYRYPKHEMYVLIIRNVILKMSVIAILCFYWLHSVAKEETECWESFVGQDLYRLVIIDFIFCLFGSFFGEFLLRIIGTKCYKKLGVPEFDIARNVLDLIYAQTLAWIGIFFAPLLPLIQVLKIFILFYVKKISLMMNCHPPRRPWRAAQMTTVFILLLFFPSFIGVVSMVAVTIWREKPSIDCGPFRGQETMYETISIWISALKSMKIYWVIWIYENLIESSLFFFILTIIILIIVYLYWQIVSGRKMMVRILQEQISNEGMDKAFLLEKLHTLQKEYGKPVTLKHKASPDKRKEKPEDQLYHENRQTTDSELAGNAEESSWGNQRSDQQFGSSPSSYREESFLQHQRPDQQYGSPSVSYRDESFRRGGAPYKQFDSPSSGYREGSSWEDQTSDLEFGSSSANYIGKTFRGSRKDLYKGNQNLNDSQEDANFSLNVPTNSFQHQASTKSNVLALAMMARQRAEMEEDGFR
ncbi:transmembrane channel-like protein 5 [Protopterus annectens]|uniref:transmembrane channel-like protein 5 n=1 Tax=Protopterus annectens TaxID=7888 RepID=UPI001CFA8966|nr:transmembrane channel-like protein 5 [Protopterus annectens]XP_043945672.1 transmembrane channel-like protein 5 [Protopterus annectens]XP_043945673.1 transmembrane channel-like protein 5 [Protopterus annectens]